MHKEKPQPPSLPNKITRDASAEAFKADNVLDYQGHNQGSMPELSNRGERKQF